MFSVVMTVCDCPDLAPRSIESVFGQTYKDYELLIIDDGSCGNLEEAIAPFLSEKITCRRIEGTGTAAARNFALEQATGSMIAYLDAGNVWRPDFLSAMYEATSGNSKSCEAAYSMADGCNQQPKGGQLRQAWTTGAPFDLRRLLAENYISMNAFVHSRRVHEHVGKFDGKLGTATDWDFIIRVASLFDCAFVSDTLVSCLEEDFDTALAANRVSSVDRTAIRKKYARFDEPIKFVHDSIEYTWSDVPEPKYRNWTRIYHEQLNTTDYTTWGYPFFLQIEPSNACNLECPLCPVGQKLLGREPRLMKLTEFQSIIDDMERYLLFLVLWHWGEPFMNRDLPEMIRYASERGIKSVTSTNGHFLDDREYVEAILTSGLSTLIVAVDSVHDENYVRYRRKGSLSKVLSGLQRVVETKKRTGSKTLINMRMVIMKDNEDDLPELRRLARKLGADWFSVRTVHVNYDETVPDSEIVAKNPKYRYHAYKPGTYERIRIDAVCRQPWELGCISSNGDITPCCYDYRNIMSPGNVFENPLTEIWNSDAYRRLRMQVHNQMQSLEVCSRCELNFKCSKVGWFLESHPTGYAERLARNGRRLAQLCGRIKNRLF